MGLFASAQKDTVAFLEDAVYQWWDGSSEAPPKQRPKEAIPSPSLSVLTWNGSAPGFGSSLMQKFPPDSQEYADLQIFIENVKKMYPSTVVGDPRSSVVEGNVGTVRAAGKPDYSIDGGPVVDGHV